jgi:hypothetical protein
MERLGLQAYPTKKEKKEIAIPFLPKSVPGAGNKLMVDGHERYLPAVNLQLYAANRGDWRLDEIELEESQDEEESAYSHGANTERSEGASTRGSAEESDE